MALSFDIPELIVLNAKAKKLRVETIYFTQCAPSWSADSEMTFYMAKTVLLYTCPLLFMSVAYCQIVRVLWRSDNIPGHTESNKYQPYHNTGVNGGRRPTLCSTANTTTESQLRSRRKAAKMLVAVVVMFAVCYLPIHLMNILRYLMYIPQNDVMTSLSMVSHWLCYANSAINPVIYNFMSAKFRKEFRITFGFWCCREGRRRSFRRGRSRTTSVGLGGSVHRFRYTSTSGPRGTSIYTCARTEVVPLSAMGSHSVHDLHSMAVAQRTL